MRHPEPGEADAAARVLNERLKASVSEEDGSAFAEVNIKTGEMRGESQVMLANYGDLFIVGEEVAIAVAPCRGFLTDIATGTDPESALLSLWMLAAAHGALQERARWER